MGLVTVYCGDDVILVSSLNQVKRGGGLPTVSVQLRVKESLTDKVSSR